MTSRCNWLGTQALCVAAVVTCVQSAGAVEPAPPGMQRMETRLGWNDLKVTAQNYAALQSIATGSLPGRKATVLFSGGDRAAQFQAAEVLARETHRALYRIDLSLVVSKYIGETEKNLNRILDRATAVDAVLFFDEVDSLFGRSTDATDPADRYANQQIDYLLQRLERLNGLAIFTSNLRARIDPALLRRFRNVVDFAAVDPAVFKRRVVTQAP